MRSLGLGLAAMLLLAACGGGDRGLRNLSSDSNGPDEFSVQPGHRLEVPESLSALPQPTPGGTNITDATPNADAIAILGGNAGANVAGGIPASDQALVTQAGRYGVTADIRAELAEEDARFRRARGRLGLFNLFGRDRYFSAYAGQALDAQAELTRLRAAGARTPSAPPAQ